MFSQFYSPLPHLKDYIKYYIIFDTALDDFNQSIQCSIPYYCPILIFTVSDNAPTFVLEGNTIANVTAHIGGQTFSPIYMDKPGNYRIIVVFFRPNGAYHLFGVPQKEYLSQFVTLQDLLGKKINCISQRIYENRISNNRIVKVLNTYFLGFLKDRHVTKTYIDLAITLIAQQNGKTRIEDLCIQLNVNPRTLRRDFSNQVGASPKEFSRILRLNRLHKYLMYYSHISIHDLVYKLGYFDQAHLINDFKKYAHYTPGSLENNLIIKNFLKADTYFENFPLTDN